MLNVWSDFVHYVSFEWLLAKRPNGGDIIFLRAFLIAIVVYLVAIGLKHALDPSRTLTFDLRELKGELVATLPWFGAIFAGVYVALYTRFSSQWLYLADVYNRIKEAEARTAREDYAGAKEIIATWKAGFIEDAGELHLATKGLFAPIIKAWGGQEAVKQKFIENTPGRKQRFDILMEGVQEACARHESKYAPPEQSSSTS